MKQAPPLRQRRLPLGLAGTLVLALALPATGLRVGAQTPPPPPVPNPSATPLPTPVPTPLPTAGSTAVPSATPGVATPSPTPEPKGRRRGKPSVSPSPAQPEPTPTPTSPAFASLDGTWEVQVQYIDHTEYSYLKLAQAASGGLSGTWKVSGHELPLDGTYDGRLIRIVVKQAAGDVTLAGYVEAAADMVGVADYGNGKTIPFTAEHRASSRDTLKKI